MVVCVLFEIEVGVFVYFLCNVGWLFVNDGEYGCGFGVEVYFVGVVDVFDDVVCYVVEIDDYVGGDFIIEYDEVVFD